MVPGYIISIQMIAWLLYSDIRTQKKVKIFSMALVIFYGSFIGLLILPAEGFNLPGQLGRPAEQRIPNTCQTLSGKPLNL